MRDVDRVARAICREQCAHYGEQACFTVIDDEGCLVRWPNHRDMEASNGWDEQGNAARAEADLETPVVNTRKLRLQLPDIRGVGATRPGPRQYDI